jgi:peroxiredoxin
VVILSPKCSSDSKDKEKSKSSSEVLKSKDTTAEPSASGDRKVSSQAKKRKGPRALDFTLRDTSGDVFTLSKEQGKVVLVNFWATWCPPCRMEIPELIKLYHKLKDEEFELVGVSLDRTKTQAVEGARKFKIPYRILHDTGGKVATLYDIISIPSIFIIDTDGIIRYVHKGYNPRSLFKMESEILSLLAEQSERKQS